MHSPFRRTCVALSIPAVLLLSACSDNGLGDTDALSGVDLHFTDEGTPEVILRSPLELEEEASRVLDRGDGEDIDEGQILEVSHAVADPESGEIQEESFSADNPSMIYLPQMQEQSEFIYDSLTDTDLTIGSEIALFEPANAETGASATLLVLRVEDQSPAFAEGGVQEQDGELPEIENEQGVLPELLGGNDGEEPEEVSTEVLIQGDGEEVAAEDQVVVRYSGWKWSDGELFDSNWPQDDEEPDAGPAGFPLSSLVPGWAEGLEGEQVGSRVLLVIPPESGYGESDEDAEEGTQHELAGETLIFVVDLIASAEAPEAAAPAPESGQPELSEEDIQEMIEQMEAEQGGAEDGAEGEDSGSDDTSSDEANSDEATDEETD
ncbi:FKBP-type peptidyl-prolyl cis-trans isomerase [Nesterenkonia aurantiaca]|uniref:peptidylprolyl isomerase n=1 Tax=Nesterenkonia aurantiaca TaxID=1436010 RepID=A0A4R7FX64_9MICC|nr:FKBP-type peptidyl-prolyl cis-trans isomerase [Nesterenkonia aurantiaca]TDS83374.1 peptidylprolyl isomerase [Nesterenkonia aurantiaca]